jgi:hypothetical protein
MDDNKFWLSLWAIVFLGTSIIVSALLLHDYYSDQLYLKSGFKRIHIEGQGMQWIADPLKKD